MSAFLSDQVRNSPIAYHVAGSWKESNLIEASGSSGATCSSFKYVKRCEAKFTYVDISLLGQF